MITDNLHRETRQRKAILKVLRSTDIHPTAEWIYEEVKKILPNISKGTVYRNLKILLAAGSISALKTDGDKSRFESRCDTHCHFVCINCGSVRDIDDPLDDDLTRRMSESTGLHILSHRLEFRGECSQCLTGTPG